VPWKFRLADLYRYFHIQEALFLVPGLHWSHTMFAAVICIGRAISAWIVARVHPSNERVTLLSFAALQAFLMLLNSNFVIEIPSVIGTLCVAGFFTSHTDKPPQANFA
jgi:hypothetical protein